MRRDFPVYAVRCAPRSLVSGAGGGGRGADVRSGSGGRRVGRGAAAVAGGDDEPDVPGAQARTGGGDRDAAAGEAGEECRGGGFEFPDETEEHTSELQSLMRISYAVFCLKTKKQTQPLRQNN